MVLQTSGLTKYYGTLNALDNLSLTVEKGAVYGFLGPNGSGKSTSLGIILGVIHQTSGSYRWFNEAPTAANRNKIGAVLEHPNFIPYLSAIQNLKLVADIKEVDKKQIPAILKKVGLAERGSYAFRTFSLGMKQRLAIGAALLGSPEVLVLDEPTNGLDPQGIVEIRNLILQIATEGTTVILASHLLDEVQKVCSHVAVLKSGQVLYAGNVEGIISDKRTIEVSAHDMNALEKALKAISRVKNLRREDKVWLVEYDELIETADLNTILHEQGVVVSHLALRSSNLEKDFLALLASKK